MLSTEANVGQEPVNIKVKELHSSEKCWPIKCCAKYMKKSALMSRVQDQNYSKMMKTNVCAYIQTLSPIQCSGLVNKLRIIFVSYKISPKLKKEAIIFSDYTSTT